jgi:hypothetical protein
MEGLNDLIVEIVDHVAVAITDQTSQSITTLCP